MEKLCITSDFGALDIITKINLSNVLVIIVNNIIEFGSFQANITQTTFPAIYIEISSITRTHNLIMMFWIFGCVNTENGNLISLFA